jgi:hypothetical protein
MKSARLLPLVPLLFAACGTVHDWREVRSAPMPLAACYDGLEQVATRGSDAFAADVTSCDRGLGTWQSRWRVRQLPMFGVGRYRLRAEILLEEGSAAAGWTVRYVIEQQKVKDPRKRDQPEDKDWSDEGQDAEAEAIFGDRLARRLAALP